MGKVIEVYVRTQEKTTHNPVFVQSDPGHSCTHTYGDGLLQSFECKVEKVLPENEKQALEIAKTVAKDIGLKVKVYDLSTRIGRFRAQFKKVEMTPTVMLGGQRIVSNITRDSLIGILNQYNG